MCTACFFTFTYVLCAGELSFSLAGLESSAGCVTCRSGLGSLIFSLVGPGSLVSIRDLNTCSVLQHSNTTTRSRPFPTTDEMRDNDKSAPPARTAQMTDYSSSEMDEELGETRVHSRRSAGPAHDEGMSQSVTSPARGDRDELARTYEMNARLERVPAHLPNSAAAAHHDRGAPTTSASASMAHTREEVLPKDQSTCPLFRLPPELRNTIYTYVAYSKFSLPQFEWDEEHNSPKLDLESAQPLTPSNELLRTCRSIYDESEGIFVRAKTQFWSDTTFTLTLPILPIAYSFRCLECLTDDQVSNMTRINIDKHGYGSQLFTVHVRSGSEADSSVTYSARVAGCNIDNNGSYLPAPLSFVERVVVSDQVRGQLSYRNVYDILWNLIKESERPREPFCVKHQRGPVVFSLRDLNRVGLMAVILWISHGCGCI